MGLSRRGWLGTILGGAVAAKLSIQDNIVAEDKRLNLKEDLSGVVKTGSGSFGFRRNKVQKNENN